MSEDIQYGGHTIEPQSYESDGGRWRPKAVLSYSEGGCVQTKQIWDRTRAYATEDEANEYAVRMSMKWIDERG